MQESTYVTNVPDGIYVGGIPGVTLEYPRWLYHEWMEPVLVKDADAEEEARTRGYDRVRAPTTVVRHLINWRFDLEDLSARQLVGFAKDEFEVDLPVEAGREKLFKSIWRLHIAAPDNRDRVVLLAHSIRMDYDETLEAIRSQVEGVEPVLVEEFEA